MRKRGTDRGLNVQKPEHLKFFSPEDREKFTDASARAPEPAASLFRVMAATGLRIGEAVRLQAEDVEEREGKTYLHVHTLKSGREGTIPRGQRPELVRIIPIISPDAKQVLKTLVRKAVPPGWLFPSRRGLHITVQYAGIMFKRVLADAGLDPRYSTHCLRHTMGYALWKASQDIVFVSRMLRHGSQRSSEIYTHLTLDDLATIAEAKKDEIY